MKKILMTAMTIIPILFAIGCSKQNSSSSEANYALSSSALDEMESEISETMTTKTVESELDIDSQSFEP